MMQRACARHADRRAIKRKILPQTHHAALIYHQHSYNFDRRRRWKYRAHSGDHPLLIIYSCWHIILCPHADRKKSVMKCVFNFASRRTRHIIPRSRLFCLCTICAALQSRKHNLSKLWSPSALLVSVPDSWPKRRRSNTSGIREKQKIFLSQQVER